MLGPSTTYGVTLVQNKENSLAGRLRREPQTSQSTTTTQTPNRGQGGSSSAETSHYPALYYQSEAGQSLNYNQGEFIVPSYTPAPSKRSKNGTAVAEDSRVPSADSQNFWTYEADYNTQQDIDFTSDDITELGATLYEQEPATSLTTQPQSIPGQNPTTSTPPATASPLRDGDVSVLLRHIQNALGMSTAYALDSGKSSPAEPRNLQEIQRKAIKQELSQGVFPGKRQQKKKGKRMPK